MTDLITRDPNDTGEIPGDSTRNLKPEIRQALLHVSPNLRSADATEVIPIVEEPLFEQFRQPSLTGEILNLDTGGYPKPKPIPKPSKHAWNNRAGDFPTVRRSVPELVPGAVDWNRPPQHRAPAPGWTRWLVGSGSVLFVLASVVVAVLAVIR